MHKENLLPTILSLPKTILFNFRCFDLKTAVKLPVFVHFRTQVSHCGKGKIRFLCPIKTGTLKLGFGGTSAILEGRRNFLSLEGKSVMEIGGPVTFSEGFSIQNKGHIKIGGHSYFNKNAKLFCSDKILIGDDFLSGWDIEIRDMNGHRTSIDGNSLKDHIRGIEIGDHVWFAAYTCALPGSKVASGSMVAFKSIVLGRFTEENVLLAGYPAKVKKTNIKWEH